MKVLTDQEFEDLKTEIELVKKMPKATLAEDDERMKRVVALFDRLLGPKPANPECACKPDYVYNNPSDE